MVTVWTLLIVFAVAYGNALVSLIGVRMRERQGMRLWANDEGYYLPRHLGHMGFYRGLYINLGFAGTSFALAAIFLPGDSSFFGREFIFVIALVNFIWGIIVGCVIPSDFDEVLVFFAGKSRRVALIGLIAVALYVASEMVIAHFVGALVSLPRT